MTSLHRISVDCDIRRGLSPEVVHGWDSADNLPRDQCVVDRWGARRRAGASCDVADRDFLKMHRYLLDTVRYDDLVIRAVLAGELAARETKREKALQKAVETRRKTQELRRQYAIAREKEEEERRIARARRAGREQAQRKISGWLSGAFVPRSFCRVCDGEGQIRIVNGPLRVCPVCDNREGP
jgi:hypothetical protein